MFNTKADRAENLKRLGCLIAILCFAAVVAGFFAPLHSPKHRAEDLLKKGAAAFDAQDFETAAKCFTSAAELGNAEAQYQLGLLSYQEKLAIGDKSEPAKWILKAAENGHAEAQMLLSLLYHEGEWIEKNDAESIKWLRKAAEQGHVDAQVCLGECYRTGEGVEKDLAEAKKWFEKAAAQGNGAAKALLRRLASE